MWVCIDCGCKSGYSVQDVIRFEASFAVVLGVSQTNLLAGFLAVGLGKKLTGER